MQSPLVSVALFHLGPVPITAGVVVTWVIMAVLVIRMGRKRLEAASICGNEACDFLEFSALVINNTALAMATPTAMIVPI